MRQPCHLRALAGEVPRSSRHTPNCTPAASKVRTSNGDWAVVPAEPGSVLVNCGKFLELWSKGVLPAAHHRVVVPQMRQLEPHEGGRLSVVFFFTPNWDAVCDIKLPGTPSSADAPLASSEVTRVGDYMPFM